MAKSGGVNGVAVATVAVGVVLVWSGIRGASVLLTVQEIIQGRKPSGENLNPIGLPDVPRPAPSGGGGGGAGGGGGGATPTPTPGLGSTKPKGGKLPTFNGQVPDFTQQPKVEKPKVALPVIPETHITAPKPKNPWWHFW